MISFTAYKKSIPLTRITSGALVVPSMSLQTVVCTINVHVFTKELVSILTSLHITKLDAVVLGHVPQFEAIIL